MKQKELQEFHDNVELANLNNGHFKGSDESQYSYGASFDNRSQYTIRRNIFEE